MSYLNHYDSFNSEAPNLYYVNTGVFGDDYGLDDHYIYGGTPFLPSGHANPEDSARFPQEMYDEGLVTPGVPVTVRNAGAKKSAVVIPRDSRDGKDSDTGMDLRSHTIKELGYPKDGRYVLDLKPVKGYPVADHPPYPSHVIHPATQSDAGESDAAPNPSPEGIGQLAAPSEMSQSLVGAPGGAGGSGGSEEQGGAGSGGDGAGSDNSDASATSSKPVDKYGGIMSKESGQRVISYPDGSKVYEDGHWTKPMPEGGIAYYDRGKTKPTMIKDPAAEADLAATKKAFEKGWRPDPNKSKEENDKSRSLALGYYPPTSDAGEAALAQESPSMQARIKNILAGRDAPPSTNRNNAFNQHIWDLLYAKDPNYTPQSFATYKNFTTGKDADSLLAMDAALEHLANVKDTVAKLDPSKYKAFNTIENFMKSNTDDPELQRLKTDITALSAQLAGFYKGQGRAPTDPEIQGWENKVFSSTMGPKQFNASIDETLKLMEGQYNAIKNKYLRATGASDTNFQFVSPRTQKLLKDKFGMDGFGSGSNGEPSSSTGSAPGQAAAAPAAPSGRFLDKETNTWWRLKPGGDKNNPHDYIAE